MEYRPLLGLNAVVCITENAALAKKTPLLLHVPLVYRSNGGDPIVLY